MMECMVLEAFNEPLVLRERPIPTPGDDEVVIKVGACGICATDLKVWSGSHPAIRKLPQILGHEVAGEVVEIGKSVDKGLLGKHAVIYFYLSCGVCPFCKSGREILCTQLKGQIGFNRDGGYAEYVKTPADSLFLIPLDLAFEKAAILTDAIATPYRAITAKAKIQPGQTMAVMGAGGLGLHAVQIARALGARVFAMDIKEKALTMARRVGAEKVFLVTNEDPLTEILELTGGEGFDVVMDFVGKPSLELLGLNLLKVAGKFVAVGYTPTDSFQVQSMKLVSRELEIYGSRSCGREDLKETIELVSRGKVKPVVAESHPLTDANVALRKLEQGDLIGRSVLVPGKKG
ncbi:MAG TPA: alcohol dehydrogenase catalytic domain-containing protein [Thermodesulfobacteriota bacterium]|nr:alcohol dehydrogenase catalytic domain-containing protein [Thermodesulfobacteriota bacterium]